MIGTGGIDPKVSVERPPALDDGRSDARAGLGARVRVASQATDRR